MFQIVVEVVDNGGIELGGYPVDADRRLTSKQRWPGLPQVPTFEESGFPGYGYSAWIGVLAKVGTPQSELVKLERQILAIGATE